MVNNLFFNRAVYETIRKMTVQWGRAQMTIWYMRIACWIPKLQTHTLTIYNTYCLSTATMDARTRLTATLYVNCLSGFDTAYAFITLNRQKQFPTD
jgi:hypothetical protein